jgi:LysM repeat protein
MKRFFLLAAFILHFSFAWSQADLVVQHSDKGMFLTHTVAPKENFYSVGRLFNIPPKEIASFNNLDMNNGLNIGQVIRIPLNQNNFSQSSTSGRAVYYVVGEKEGLYRVSVKNNNVLMADLRKWNKLSSDNISAGKKMIVGYLVSTEAANIVAVAPQEKPVEKKPEPKKEVAEVITEVKVQKPDPPKTFETRPQPAQPVSNPAPQAAVNDGSGGFFRSLYEKQVKTQSASYNETVSAGIFKTVSGWQDAKYYVLMDKIDPGTIIRITNPTNNKTIFAKVLGEMSGIRQNQGYDLRMSNAAAAALDVSDLEKFIVRVQY